MEKNLDHTTRKPKSYLVSENGKQMGPYSVLELQQYLREGKVTYTSLIWAEGMTGWVPANSIPEFGSTASSGVASALASSGVPLPQIPRSRMGDLHYEQNVFPKIESGKNSFNWQAFFFPYFWLAYKGLWKYWAIWTISFMAPFELLIVALKNANVLHLFLGGLVSSLVLGLGLGVTTGFSANRLYFKHYNELLTARTPVSKGNGLSGIGGCIAFAVMSAVVKILLLRYF
ncbi:MAG: GYF domain-containing protein [Nitrospiria bacterium]